ncbi:unnamed protein product, partial [Amoebophrya sp. A120]|eukprot:GSA120T00002986001.1
MFLRPYCTRLDESGQERPAGTDVAARLISAPLVGRRSMMGTTKR